MYKYESHQIYKIVKQVVKQNKEKKNNVQSYSVNPQFKNKSTIYK